MAVENLCVIKLQILKYRVLVNDDRPLWRKVQESLTMDRGDVMTLLGWDRML